VGVPTLISDFADFVVELDILNEGFAESCLGGCSAGNSSSDVSGSVSVLVSVSGSNGSLLGSAGGSRGSLSQLYLLLQVAMVECLDKHQRVLVDFNLLLRTWMGSA
jgi:hypothetical protein